MNEVKQRIITAYELLQRMQITAIKANVDAISYTLTTLQMAQKAIPDEEPMEKPREEKTDGAD